VVVDLLAERIVLKKEISSVKELEDYSGEQEHLLDWIERLKHIFTEPTPEVFWIYLLGMYNWMPLFS